MRRWGGQTTAASAMAAPGPQAAARSLRLGLLARRSAVRCGARRSSQRCATSWQERGTYVFAGVVILSSFRVPSSSSQGDGRRSRLLKQRNGQDGILRAMARCNSGFELSQE